MAILTSVMRAHLKAFSPLQKWSSMEAVRAFQDKKGELMSLAHINEAERMEPMDLGGFEAAWAVPRRTPGRGAILYLHGGGYCAGDLPYALGFGTILASCTGRRVLCPAYRLAPENPFPAALDDAFAAYEYLLEQGYSPDEIIFCGESAGGGLILSLCLRMRELGMELPAGLIPISPWTDLSLSGESYKANRDVDPSLGEPLVEYYANAYAGEDRRNPLVSPLFGDYYGFPPTKFYAGSDEILLSDTLLIEEKMREQGVQTTLFVGERLWHVYVLYGISEAKMARSEIGEFVEELIR